ncbi:MAG: TRAP transporter substrate-binding protein DctP [Burkholderiales bacterium]|nr:TRAP transporter substrate-binding protein DctP [Burkholderiales bacterium]
MVDLSGCGAGVGSAHPYRLRYLAAPRGPARPARAGGVHGRADADRLRHLHRGRLAADTHQPGQQLSGAGHFLCLAYWENGFFNATNSKHPIARVEDFNGLKFRSIQARITQETIRALGANPVPLAVPELYTALETRTIDGQGTPNAVIAALKLYEVQKFLSITQHTYGAFIPLVSKKFWDKLTPAQQKIVKDAAAEARSFQRQVARDQAASAQKMMADRGMKVNEVTDAERARMRKAVQPVWDTFTPDVGADLVKQVEAELKK